MGRPKAWQRHASLELLVKLMGRIRWNVHAPLEAHTRVTSTPRPMGKDAMPAAAMASVTNVHAVFSQHKPSIWTHGPSLTPFTALAMLPLACVASVATALEDGPTGFKSNRRVDAAGYESDGGEELEVNLPPKDESKIWKWRFSKSPLGKSALPLSLPVPRAHGLASKLPFRR